MSNCKEFLSEVIAITAIPVANISASQITSVANLLTPTVPAVEFKATVTVSQVGQDSVEKPNPVYKNAVTIGLLPAVSGVTLIPMRRLSGKAKDSESDSVAGRMHTVTVTCEVDERNSNIWERLLALERNAHHLLLTYRDGKVQAFVAVADTYFCDVDRDGLKTGVQFRIQNLMGIQQLV